MSNSSSNEWLKNIIKLSTRRVKLPSCEMDIAFLKKLYCILKEINEEATKFDIELVDKLKAEAKETEKVKEAINENHKILIQILGEKGELVSSPNETILNEEHLPNAVEKIIFDNTSLYNFAYKQNPQHGIRVEIDFHRPSVFDLSIKASDPTPNFSEIEVSGIKDTWVTGCSEKILELFGTKKNNRGWLHKRNIYDIFVLVLIFPFAFILLYNLDASMYDVIGPVHSIFYVALYVYFFILFLYIFLFIFKYARWVYPYIEFVGSTKSFPMIHRVIFHSIFWSIVGKLLYDLIKIIFY